MPSRPSRRVEPAVAPPSASNAEQVRLALAADREAGANWQRWGPYLAERQWGTVREDYSPDGEWIYFNSSRTGLMQIWRVRVDGSAVERITDSAYGDWFPHPSPKGDKVVFISYDADVFDHPRDLDVRVRLMDIDGGNVETLFDLFGGQGTMNSPNWSPDGDEFAYVRYFPVA